MASIPIPTQAPIERAGWSTDFSPSGLLTPANNDRTPVNPINIANQTSELQSQNMLRGAQTAGAISDVQMKQRGMQASMLGAIANLAPDQYEAARNNIIPIINRLNPSFQFDPSIDQQTARMAAMSAVPVAEQPQYGLTQSNAAINQALLKSLGGGQGVTNAQEGLAPPGGQPAQPGVASSAASSAAPPPATGISPQAQQLLAIARPDASNALNNITKTSYDSPEVKAKTALDVKNSDNLADAQKTYNVAASSLPRALQRFQQLRDASKDASYGLGVDAEGGGLAPKFAQTGGGKFFEPNTATANQIIQQASKQGVLNELGPQLAGLKGNKFLESIASGASGLNASDPPATKVNAINGLETQYIANMKQLAAQRRAYGDKTAPTDAEIDAMVKQNSGTAGQANSALQKGPSTPNLVPGQTIYKDHIYMGGKPSSPASWKAVKSSGGASGGF